MLSLLFRKTAALAVAALVFGLFAGAPRALAMVDLTLPAGQAGVAYTTTVTTNPAPGPGATFAATGLPTGLAINASSGVISGTPAASGAFTGTIAVTDGAITNNFTYSLAIAAALGTPEITNALTALGGVGEAFDFLLTASNSPTSFNVGALPAGLAFDAGTARITGTPALAGAFTVALSANNASGTGASVNLALTIDPAGPVPAITSAATASGALGAAFTYQITASNTPTSFTASGLPVGLTLDSTSGLISGTPTVAGVSVVALTAANANGSSATFNLTLSLGPVSTITSAATVNGFAGAAITPYQVTGSNTPTSFNVGALPAGLSFSSGTNQITGTPTVAATTTAMLSANNAVGTGPAFTLTFAIAAPVAPVITTQPAGQTVTAGANVTFTVVATGTPAPTFQWRKDGTPIGGATAASLTLSGVATGAAGAYTVVVTNAGGSVTSAAANLVVNAPPPPPPPDGGGATAPVITLQPAGRTANAGATAEFTVTATGTAPLTFQWRKDGVGVANGTTISGATTATLTLAALTSASAGSYTVVVTNSAGSATSAAAVLTVIAPPQIASPPAAQSGPVGGTATFTVAATGTAPFTYQWARNGVALPGATAASLTLASLKVVDAGLYTVTVTNAAGSVTSNGAALGITTTDLLAGDAFSAPAWRAIVHPNGNIYTQVLLTGPAATVTADPGKVTRLSYVDLQDDIVQIEFSGAGTMTVTLDNATGPAAPLNYNQAVQYMKGHASLFIQGAGPSTFVSAFAVGRLTSFDPTGGFDLAQPASATNDPANNANPIFKTGVDYDGHADLALLSIASPTGQFGGILMGNVAFGDTKGLTGIFAPGVTVMDRIRLHDLRAFDAATPVLVLGASPNSEDGLRITGGDLLQANGRAIRLSGVNRVLMSAGVDAHNRAESAQVNQARFERDGVDVTPIVVVPAGVGP